MHPHDAADGTMLERTSIDLVEESFIRYPGKLYLLCGDPLIFPVSMTIAARALANGISIATVDGCNGFDVHAIAKFGRQHCLNPEALLKRIFISRGFTCYQMEAVITKRLLPQLEQMHSRTALIFGLLDTFYDEQAPLREVCRMLERVLGVLQSMKSQGISVLLACREWNVLPKERNQLLTTLKHGVDRVYRLMPDECRQSEWLETSAPQLYVEQQRKLDHGTHSTNIHKHY